MIEIILLFLQYFVGLLGFWCFIATCTLLADFPKYSKYYKAMVECRSINLDDSYDSMIFNGDIEVGVMDDRGFRLGKNTDCFLFADYFTYSSPYSLYWLIKYKRYIRFLQKRPQLLFIYTTGKYVEQSNVSN